MPDAPKTDTTYVLSRGSSFNGRVEPFWMHFRMTRSQRGVIGSFLEKRRLKAFVETVKVGLARQTAPAPAAAWDRADGECVANIKIARMGLLQGMREVVLSRAPASINGQLRHFLKARDWNTYWLPVDFTQPLIVSPATNSEPMPIASSIRLREELDAIMPILKPERTMNVLRMVPFLRMTEPDVAKAEKEADDPAEFWHALGFAVLKKLVDVSVQHVLPVVFA